MFLLEPSTFFWDLTIAIILVSGFCFSIGCRLWIKRNPTKILQKTLVGLLGFLGFLGFLITFYASFVEPQILVTTRHQLDHPLAPSIKIALVSDLHVGPYKNKKNIEKVVKRIEASVPDLVLLAGDFVNSNSASLSDLSPLADIHAPLGIFAVLGNHDIGESRSLLGKREKRKDRGDEIEGYLEQLGINVLRNENTKITSVDGDFFVAGINDLWGEKHNLKKSLQGIPKNKFIILLSHNPSILDRELSTKAHLITSGHTHGGQIRLPGFGPLSSLPTTLGQKYDHGLFGMNDDTTLIITRGAGETTNRMRLFAWPEIVTIELSP